MDAPLGCCWCVYYDGCKFGKGGMNKVNKFKLTYNNDNRDKKELELKERNLENTVNNLADQVGNLFEAVVPQAFKNMTICGGQAEKCRIGDSRKSGDELPFSGFTAVSDFCAHSHTGLCLHSKISFSLAFIKFSTQLVISRKKFFHELLFSFVCDFTNFLFVFVLDINNMVGGLTAVVTLVKPENRILGIKPEDEQLHVLPHYAVDKTDEFDSIDGQNFKVTTGQVILTKFS